MAKVKLTWQKDDTHSQDYSEDVSLGERLSRESKIFDLKFSRSDLEKDEGIICKLDRASMAVAFHECAQRLQIIQGYLGGPIKPWWNKLIRYRTLDERFTLVDELREEFEQEEYEKIEYTDFHKILKELCLIVTTLKENIREISMFGTFKKLLSVVDTLNKESMELQNLKELTLEYEVKYNSSTKKVVSEQKKFTADIMNVVTQISKLKCTVEDVDILKKTEYRYIDSWENARLSQHQRTLTIEEDVFNNNITSCDQKKEYENRIHKEIENYLLENTEDYRNDIQYWMNEYDVEVERMDDAIIFLKGKWETLTDDHQKLVIVYHEHKEMCEKWLVHREEMRVLAEWQLKCSKAAVKIQAWWRGTMYRKQLGPYRKKGKGKGKDKKKGKK